MAQSAEDLVEVFAAASTPVKAGGAASGTPVLEQAGLASSRPLPLGEPWAEAASVAVAGGTGPEQPPGGGDVAAGDPLQQLGQLHAAAAEALRAVLQRYASSTTFPASEDQTK